MLEGMGGYGTPRWNPNGTTTEGRRKGGWKADGRSFLGAGRALELSSWQHQPILRFVAAQGFKGARACHPGGRRRDDSGLCARGAQALKMCLERILPPVRERPCSFKLPPISTAAEAAACMALVLDGMASGEILPGEGAALSGTISA
jgi:hypothetical protein